MWSLRPALFKDLSGWNTDDHSAALETFARHSLKPTEKEYRQGAIGLDPAWFNELIVQAQTGQAQLTPRRFFEENFCLYRMVNLHRERGQVTGFYEPEVRARTSKSHSFQVPILSRPSDLLALNDENRPAHIDPSYRFGRNTPDGSIGEYYDRKAIQKGAIKDKKLAIAYVEDPIEAFFIHIQGAARLIMEDGTTIQVTYDGKSGHPFTSIGRLLIERGEVSPQDVSMQSIKTWLTENQSKASELMEENRSYIFFKRADVAHASLGPVAAAKIPLTGGRSLAVDRVLHTFSTPVFVQADQINGQSFDRLMIAQETGSAIVGPARGDIFFGSGNRAGRQAGSVNSPCDFSILVPKDAPFSAESVKLS